MKIDDFCSLNQAEVAVYRKFPGSLKFFAIFANDLLRQQHFCFCSTFQLPTSINSYARFFFHYPESGT
jgi:hypothetical protein